MTSRIAIAALAAVLLAAAAPTRSQEGQPPRGDEPVNRPDLVTEPYEYTTDEGGFKVTWPSGCGELRRRETADDPDADPFAMVYVFNAYCDQFGEHGRGCSVTSVVNLKAADGGPPGPQDVVTRMEEHLEALKVNVVSQMPIQKAMPDGTLIEGLDIRAKAPNGAGEAWLRGLLWEEQIFLLSAWNITGGLWSDPEIQAFFNSFEPLVE